MVAGATGGWPDHVTQASNQLEHMTRREGEGEEEGGRTERGRESTNELVTTMQ